MSDGFGRILVVDDDPLVASSLVAFLNASGWSAVSAAGGQDAQRMIAQANGSTAPRDEPPIAVLVTDVSMPDMGGMDLIRWVRSNHREVVPLVITGYGTIEEAVRAIRIGAIDYLTKPLVDDELRIAIEKAFQQHALHAENRSLRQRLDRRDGLDEVVGDDERMRRIFETIRAVAPSPTTVLMGGESGTGKSLIARAIHRLSPRADGPFVEIACGSIPETLLESELFGHTAGSFTGAHTDKPGKFLAANGGTIFLDEVNSASPGMQLKLLRVLQERAFEPVGSNTTVQVDVRVILASNEPLEELVARGDFRQDLYYRINVVMIQLPPLRDRVGDIPMLAEHFLAEKCADVGKRINGFTDEALAALRAYSFPGNARELENIVERAIVLTRSSRIELNDLPATVVQNRPHELLDVTRVSRGPYVPMPLREALEAPERDIILAALEANDWNRQRTAEELQINRTTLYKKIKQFGLDGYGRTG